MATLTPVVAQIKDEMLELEDASPEEPSQMGLPQSPGTSASPVMLPKGFMPDYFDMPLSRFS